MVIDVGDRLINILSIEDSNAEVRLLREFLKQANQNFNLVSVKRLQEALEQLDRHCFDVILLDLTLPDSVGLASLESLLQKAPQIPIVVLTNTNDDRTAIEAVRKGAQDYLVKRQVNPKSLIRSLYYAIERKQSQGALETKIEQTTAQLLKAQEIDRLRSEFIAMLSHDFRNPINSILLSTGLLAKKEHLLSKEKKTAHFQTIRSALKNMDRLLEEILLIGKADSGKLECQLTSLNVREFCNCLVEDLEFDADNKEIQIILECELTLEEIKCDRNLLQHIFGNLLTNAIKYSPRNSKIFFRVSNSQNELIFQIQDCGIGIPPHEQKQLFEPFFRASNVGIIQGTGLGLTIVKKCVDVLGGQISLTSELDAGTTFTVILPGPIASGEIR
ncbi:MAG: hybrid sensor histidine kinase/response regulator [Prochloraceae cyanobacterium]|nr:hybrid sensor histidine kinase/response regulator [Prochloraceae cyanobacterium]